MGFGESRLGSAFKPIANAISRDLTVLHETTLVVSLLPLLLVQGIVLFYIKNN